MVTAAPETASTSLLVRIEGTVTDNEPFALYRRPEGTIATNVTTGGDAGWMLIATNLVPSGTAAVHHDTNIIQGVLYEYRAEKPAVLSSEGFGVGGLSLPAPTSRGGMLLVVEEGLTNALRHELNQLVSDLVGDGWMVDVAAVPRHNETPADAAERRALLNSVRNAISNAYTASGGSLRSVYLIGRVPVPYSLAVQEPAYAASLPPWPPDGHQEHAGCWPADQYYADLFQDFTNLNYQWTDSTRAWTNQGIPRCSTVPGDGKFDNYRAATRLDLQLGRVDFSNLPGSPLPETERVRQYLDKVHRYRMGQIPMTRSAAVSSPYASVRLTFPSWFGTNAYTLSTNLLDDITGTNGLYGVFANGAGSFTSVGTHYTSWDLMNSRPRIFLHMAHGSYFGDWDSENNLLRAALAGPEGALVSLDAMDFSYASPSNPHYHVAPDWSLCHMALGETVGYGVRHSLNRTFQATWIYTARPSAHFALLGDPSLRLFPVQPVPSCRTRINGNDVILTWEPSPDPQVTGYHIYASTNGLQGSYTKLHSGRITTTSLTHAGAMPATVHYQVRAVRDEQTGAGTYENTALAAFAIESDSERPYISILPVQLLAAEDGSETGCVVITRSGNASAGLTVYLTVSGSADASDYTAGTTDSILIPPGTNAATLSVTGQADDVLEGTETLTFELAPDPAYQAGISTRQTIYIADHDTMPTAPGGMSAVEINTNAVLTWQDLATNETRYVIERRLQTGGTETVLDNENADLVTAFAQSGTWEDLGFENAYDGTCLGIKKVDGDSHVDYAVGRAVTGLQDLAWWHPSGSVDGILTDSQHLYIHHAGGSNDVVINMQVNGASWKPLGRYDLNTGSFVRVEGVTTSYRWTIADALRIERPFLPIAEIPPDTTNWTDTSVLPGYSYQYRVRAGLANTSSLPSEAVTVVITGGGTNAVPVADAGTVASVTADRPLELNGNAQDPDDSPLPLSTTWFLVSGPGSMTFDNPAALNTIAMVSTNGTYVIGLSASDGISSVTDTVSVLILPAPIPGRGASNGTPFEVDAFTIGLWHLDGSTEDSTTNGLDLFLVNGATLSSGGQATAWMAAPAGAALRVDNFPQAVTGSVPDVLTFGSGPGRALSLEAWMYVEAWGSNSVSFTMFGMEQNWDTHINLEQGSWSRPEGWISGNRDVALADEEIVGSYWSTNTWHHFMFTFDGTNTFTASLDGVRIGTSLVSEPNWGRGNHLSLQFGNLVGYIDEIRLSSTVRVFELPASETLPVDPPVFDGNTSGLSGGMIRLGAITATGILYAVDNRTNLLNGEWTEVTNGITGNGAPLEIDILPVMNQGMYRMRVWPEP